MKDRNLIFNIFFIPETVAYQSLALVSLLLNTNFKFRLVGNSLCYQEALLLEKISNLSSRLFYTNFESDYIIPHGTLIDLMFLSESNEYYCFADSDVFLFEELSISAEEMLDNCDVFSTGSRIENMEDTQYAGFKGGATTVSPDGSIPLATSFFCIYKRGPLELVKAKYQVGFEQYRSVIEIPEPAKAVINQHSLEYKMFDTGKLLSVLIHQEGFQKQHRELPGFYHIGGMSGRYLQNIDLHELQIFDDAKLNDFSPTKSGKKLKVRDEYEINLKKFYGSYFYVYLNSLIGKASKPKLNSQIKEVQALITKLEDYIANTLIEAQKRTDTRKILELVISA